MTPAGSLRERQAAVIKEAILDALARRLDSEDPEDIAMPQVATDAGISLYRYFPTREAMFDAVGDHAVARLGLPRETADADSFLNFVKAVGRPAPSRTLPPAQPTAGAADPAAMDAALKVAAEAGQPVIGPPMTEEEAAAITAAPGQITIG